VDRQHELVADHDHRLQASAVAPSQGRRQFTVRVAAVGVQPLFELIQDKQNFFLAFGFQTIKNNSLPNNNKRVVFYTNKVAFE
jgi:hypothetical protein